MDKVDKFIKYSKDFVSGRNLSENSAKCLECSKEHACNYKFKNSIKKLMICQCQGRCTLGLANKKCQAKIIRSRIKLACFFYMLWW